MPAESRWRSPTASRFGFEATALVPDIVRRLDGILFTGGGDIADDSFDGHAYAPESHSPISLTCPARDAFEWALMRACWDADVPVLGICRGMQVLNVALGVGMFTAQSPTSPWMAIVLAASFSVYGLLKRYVPLDAIAQAENDKDMRQWEPLNSMLLISSTLAFARYDDKRMWAYDVIENAMTRNLGYSFSEEYDESAEDNEDTNEVGGQPGPRLNYGPTYYAAFVHDPEGNNIETMLV